MAAERLQNNGTINARSCGASKAKLKITTAVMVPTKKKGSVIILLMIETVF